MAKRYITYAIDKKTNACVHVESVPNGSSCNCICPLCGEDLIAKNDGRVRVPHFAHDSKSECKGAYETMLHRLAKEVLAESKELMLPGYKYFKPQKAHFETVEIEERKDFSDLQPDAVGITKYGNRLWVEICVTHKVDEVKIGKIKERDINCVEVALPPTTPLEKDFIRKILAEGVDLFTPWINQKEKYIETMKQYNMHDLPFDETEYIRYFEAEHHHPDRHWINYPFGEEIHKKNEQTPIDEYSRNQPEERMLIYNPEKEMCPTLKYTLDDFKKDFETIKSSYKERIFDWALPVLEMSADHLAYHPIRFYGNDADSVYINGVRHFLVPNDDTRKAIWLCKSTWGFFKKLQENSKKLRQRSTKRFCESCPNLKAKFIRDKKMIIFCSLPIE